MRFSGIPITATQRRREWQRPVRLQLLVAVMRAHPQVLEVQEKGVKVLHVFSRLGLFCRAPYAHRVLEVGGRAVLSAVMQAFPANSAGDRHRRCALRTSLRAPAAKFPHPYRMSRQGSWLRSLSFPGTVGSV